MDNQIDLGKVYKEFLDDSFVLGFSKELFYLRFLLGEKQINLVLTPEHLKGMAQMFSHFVSEYEKTVRLIDRQWSPTGVQSPVKMTDLRKKGDSGSSNSSKDK